MKKITLIYPPCIYPFKKNIVYSHCIGIRSISAFLKREGNYQVHFLDALMQGFQNVRPYSNGYIVGLETSDIVKRIPEDTDVIGISVPFSILAPIVHDIADAVKTRFPQAKVVLGGIYPSTQPKLALTSKADYIVIGEGETAFKDIADGKDPKTIKGVYSRDQINNTVFPTAYKIEDLDSLPYPDYTIPFMDEYFNLSPRRTIGRTASVTTSRGCPFKCEFCSIHPVYGQKFRARTPKSVIEELQYLVDTHGITMIEFEDDNLTLQKDRAIEIFEGIIRMNEKGANLSWRTPNGVRIDTLDEEIISVIAKSNCANITLALEHGDQEMLKIMQKQLRLPKVKEVLRLIKKYNIPDVVLFMIAGYPGETLAYFENSVKFLKEIREINPHMKMIVNMLQPYPGTAVFRRCMAEGYIKDPDFDNFLLRKDLTSSRHYVAVTTPDFDEKEVIRRRDIWESIYDAVPR